MSTYNVGITTTKIELQNTYGGNQVELTAYQDMFVNLNANNIRKTSFTGTVDSDATKIGDALSLKKKIVSSDLVNGTEIRSGELINIYTAGSVLKCQAKVLSSTAGSMEVELLNDVDIVATDTYSTNIDTLIKSNNSIKVDSNDSPFITLATDAAATANNLIIVAVKSNGSLVRG